MVKILSFVTISEEPAGGLRRLRAMIRLTFMAIILVQIAVAAATTTEVLWVGANPVAAAPITAIDIGQVLPAAPPRPDARLQRSSFLVLDPESAQARID